MFGRKKNTVTFDKQKFVLHWMTSAYLAGIPASVSGAQLRAFEIPFGMDFMKEVAAVTQIDFELARIALEQAFEKRNSNEQR